MHNVTLFSLGVLCAGAGGELFVRGAVGLAHGLRISPGIVGATVVAFATSSPELSVSISAALAGEPQLALGDALGSNVVNVALILGIALTFSAMHSPRGSVQRDFPVALLVPLLTAALLLDGTLSRIDGALLLGSFCVWLAATVSEARRQRSAAEAVIGTGKTGSAVLLAGVGLLLLLAAGQLITSGARGIATALGIDEFAIGATIVAVGTSLPELATTVIARWRGHDEVGLGTILGSNIFNGLWIVAIAALIHPIVVDWREVAVALIFGVLAVAVLLPNRQGVIERRRGALLLILYLAYLTALLQQHR